MSDQHFYGPVHGPVAYRDVHIYGQSPASTTPSRKSLKARKNALVRELRLSRLRCYANAPSVLLLGMLTVAFTWLAPVLASPNHLAKLIWQVQQTSQVVLFGFMSAHVVLMAWLAKVRRPEYLLKRQIRTELEAVDIALRRL